MADKGNNLKVWRDAVSAGKDCLSPEALQLVLEEESPNSPAARHVAGCPHCQAELAMMRSFESSAPLDNEGAAVAWIAAQLQRAQGMPASPTVALPWWRSLFKLPYLVATAALVLVLGLGFSIYISDRQDHSVLTAGNQQHQIMRSGSVRLTAPSGELDQIPQEFHWEAFPGATSYSIQLLEVDGSVLWSGQAEQNVLKVGPELRNKIQPGKRLLWKVAALDSAGKLVAASSQEQFRVKVKGNPHN